MHDMDEGHQDNPPTTEDQHFEVLDGERKLQFTGRLLGTASSFKPGKERWAEIDIYKTHAGRYIVAGCGRSTLNGERDKRWALVCEQPEGVIEKLHMLDGGGSRYLPFVSKQALEQARAADLEFANAYMVENVD